MASAKRKVLPNKSEASTLAGGATAGGAAVGGDATAVIVEGRVRAVIDAVRPTVDGGRFPAKRVAGEGVAVEAHCFTDGHDKLRDRKSVV